MAAVFLKVVYYFSNKTRFKNYLKITKLKKLTVNILVENLAIFVALYVHTVTKTLTYSRF